MSKDLDKCNQMRERNDGCNEEDQNRADRENRRHTEVSVTRALNLGPIDLGIRIFQVRIFQTKTL